MGSVLSSQERLLARSLCPGFNFLSECSFYFFTVSDTRQSDRTVCHVGFLLEASPTCCNEFVCTWNALDVSVTAVRCLSGVVAGCDTRGAVGVTLNQHSFCGSWKNSKQNGCSVGCEALHLCAV